MTNDITDQIPRNCANCACHDIQKSSLNPLENQMFCRRDPPTAQMMRVDQPRMRDGKVVMMKDGKTPLTETVQTLVYMHRPTLASLVCFNGWRPLHTEPGQRTIDDGMMGAMKRLYADMMAQQAEEIALPMPEDFGVAEQTLHITKEGLTHDGPQAQCDLCNEDLPNPPVWP